MESLFSTSTADQVRKTAREAQKLGSEVKSDFEGAVARGRIAVNDVVSDAKDAAYDAAGSLSGRAQKIAGSTRRSLGKAAGKVSALADENTALVTVAAFGVGVLVGRLVSRKA